MTVALPRKLTAVRSSFKKKINYLELMAPASTLQN